MQNATDKGHGDGTDHLKREMERIKGVLSASVVRDPDGGIAEIHMEASPSRHPKQIVRDTESLLYTRFGIDLDYRKISLVQLEEPTATEGRLQFVSASLLSQEESVEVALRSGDRLYKGMAILPSAGTSEDKSVAAAAATATLSAMQKVIGTIVPLQLDSVFLVPADEDRVCLTIVSASSSQGRERLTGTAIIQDNILEAASKATLDAINRRLVIWTQENKGE
ncbi:MAG: hypothetical protein U9R48_09175 [Chloroflexota bacterium]|nr:hypothetical protein [Chloroflexota bacterium]